MNTKNWIRGGGTIFLLLSLIHMTIWKIEFSFQKLELKIGGLDDNS